MRPERAAASQGSRARRPSAPGPDRPLSLSFESDSSRTAFRAGQAIELLPLEFKLLESLALNAGKVVTRAMLLERVWGFHFDPRTNIVETHISRLRRKIDYPGEPSLISHVRGAGYMLAA